MDQRPQSGKRERKEKTISQHDYLIWSNDFWPLFGIVAIGLRATIPLCLPSNVEQIFHTAFLCVGSLEKGSNLRVRQRAKDTAKKNQIEAQNEFRQTIESRCRE
jgi:hypothetical protein